jgi:CheY-like chemotaxis protein
MGTPARILLVEDDENLRELLTTYLARQGYQVVAAADADFALRVLQRDQPFDLLLTDIVMPGTRDGFVLSKDARRLRPGLKVLHVTGYPERFKAHPEMARNGRIMQKPVERSALLERVGQLLGHWSVDQNDVLRRAYEYWVTKSDGNALPDRKDFDPAEVKDILPNLSILDLIGEEARSRYRLVGTRVVEALGCDPTNRFIDEVLEKDDLEFMERLVAEVSTKKLPRYAASAFKSDELGMSTERLLLPFALGGTDVKQILIVQTFDWAERVCTLHDLAQRRPQRLDSVQWP